MRRHLLAAIVLTPLAAFAIAKAGFLSPAGSITAKPSHATHAGACDSRCDPRWLDAHLRIDQLQVVGTTESYKLRPSPALMGLIRMGGKAGAQALGFGQPSLTRQLDSDARTLSFDIAYDPQGGAYKNPAGAGMAMELLGNSYVAAMKRPGFKAIHVLDVDYNSSCLALIDCLKQVAQWSRAHPRHLPIVITLHTDDARTPMPGATRPVPVRAAALDALDQEVRAAFAEDQIFTPDQLQAGHGSLREAAAAHAWPRVGAARGKVIVVLDDSADKLRAYQGRRASLEGRAMFVAAAARSPLAAFVAIADPRRDAARIAEAVRGGAMVITRADADTREAHKSDTGRRDAAFASGAQIVQSDFLAADPAIGPYRVSLADNPKAMCGPALASERCVLFQQAPPFVRTAAAIP